MLPISLSAAIAPLACGIGPILKVRASPSSFVTIAVNDLAVANCILSYLLLGTYPVDSFIRRDLARPGSPTNNALSFLIVLSAVVEAAHNSNPFLTW